MLGDLRERARLVRGRKVDPEEGTGCAQRVVDGQTDLDVGIGPEAIFAAGRGCPLLPRQLVTNSAFTDMPDSRSDAEASDRGRVLEEEWIRVAFPGPGTCVACGLTAAPYSGAAKQKLLLRW